MRRNTAIIGALAVGLALTGCTAAGGSDRSGPEVVAPAAPSDAGGGESGSTADESTGADRSVITTGTMTITTADPIEAADRAAAIVESAGGRVDARTQRAAIDASEPAEPRGASATVTLRIPSAQLTGLLDRLSALGDVDDLALTSNDVTRATQDLDARIAASQGSVSRLLELLQRSETTSELIELEAAIAQRQGDLESMQAQRRALGDQVDLSTIEAAFVAVVDAPADEPDTFVSGLLTGWTALVAFGSGALVAFGVALPWLVAFALLAGIVVAVIRRRRRRKPTPNV